MRIQKASAGMREAAMFSEIPGEQLRAALERTAHEVLAEAAIAAPPVDAIEVASRLGMIVAREEGAQQRARFVHIGGASRGRAAILLADDPRVERRHWAVAHEIGEAHAHLVFADLGVDPLHAASGARESIANHLAGCLLLPHDWFAAEGEALDWDLARLKERFATASHELIARRMLEMPPPVIITLWDQGKQQWRRSNVGRAAPLSAAEGDARRAAFELGKAVRCEPSELPEGVVDVRAWAVHEPEWKREIVRTELAEVW
jgi:Zn-dependent peptidase ImmA (M78 family)